MRFINGRPQYELTYSDVFLIPGRSEIESRFEVDITPRDDSGATIPIVISNMNAVAGKRMCETVVRRGGLTVLPQDIPHETLKETIRFIKSRHTVYETPLTLGPGNSITEALSILYKRSHGVVIIVDNKDQPVGVFQESDAAVQKRSDGHFVRRVENGGLGAPFLQRLPGETKSGEPLEIRLTA